MKREEGGPSRRHPTMSDDPNGPRLPAKRRSRRRLAFPPVQLEADTALERQLADIVAEYGPRLVAFGTRRAGSRDVAKDVVQQTFIYLWKRLAEGSFRLDGGESVSAFLHVQVAGRLADRARRERWRLGRLGEYAVELGAVARRWMHSESLTEDEERMKIIEEAKKTLPTRCREVFELAFEQEMSYAEVAEAAEVSINTVKEHLKKANVVVRRALVRAGYIELVPGLEESGVILANFARGPRRSPEGAP